LAKERKASVIYEGNGTQQTFSFPFDYLRKAFVKAEIIESSGIVELEQGKDYSITDKELTLNSGVSVATGKLLKIYRETTTDPLVEWQDASVLRSADLSLQEVQLLHLAEETADKVFDTGMSTAPTNTNVWDGQYKRLTNLIDPQEGGDAVTLRYINSNKSNFINDLKSEGAKQNSSIVSTGNTQNTRLTNTGNSYVSTMTTLKGDTTTKANEAKNSATSASSSASTATTKANEAKSSATSASSSASTATTKATEASNSAELAKKWAMSDYSPDGVSGNKSSKTWANEAKNSATSASTSASTATTKANEAKNSASAAAKSAEAAKLFDPSSYVLRTGDRITGTLQLEDSQLLYTRRNKNTSDGQNDMFDVLNIVGSDNKRYGFIRIVKNEANSRQLQFYNVNNDNYPSGGISLNTDTNGNLIQIEGKTPPNTANSIELTTAEWVNNKLSAYIPTGTVLPFAGNTVPKNYLLCDGSAVSRSTYANLFKIIGTTYGSGNGSTTFNLPNLVDRFVEGGSASGVVKQAGLPNIKGTCASIVWSFSDDRLETQAFSPPFSGYKIVENGEHFSAGWNSSSTGGRRVGVTFNAADANMIYGASPTVQPPAIVMKYIIKI
jgi:phage-related tail fiber protein